MCRRSSSQQADNKSQGHAAGGAMSPSAQALELMEAVFRGPLNPAQQQLVITALQNDPSFVHECNVTPQKVPYVCECPVS